MFKIAIITAIAALMPFCDHLPLITESPVYATIKADTTLYSHKTLKEPKVNLTKGDVVEVLEDYSTMVYKVDANGMQGWVEGKNINIHPEPPIDKTELTKGQLEAFVNDKAYDSDTDMLMLVEINRQKTHVFQGGVGSWQLIKSLDCSTGKHSSPTVRGQFKLTQRGDWLYSKRFESGAKWWIRFHKDYLFHSTPMTQDKEVIKAEDVVGQRLSNGCVRLLLDDIYWLYVNVPDKTSVVVL